MKSFTIPALFATAVIASGCTLSPLEEDVAYERRDLWRQPAITNIGAPAVDDSALYVIDLTGAVSRLSRKDGSVVWRQPSNPAGTPRGLVRGGNTILMSASELIAFAIADGSILWRQSNAAGVGELESAALGNLVVPSIYRGSGDALALDELTGREVWRGTMLPSTFTRSSDTVVRIFEPQIRDGSIFATFIFWSLSHPEIPNRGGIGVSSITEGGTRWSRLLPVVNARASTLPSRVAVSQDVVAASTFEGYIYVYDRQTGDSLWTGRPLPYKSLSGTEASPDIRPVLALGGLVIAGSGIGTVSAFDARTGVSRWVTPSGNGATYEFDPVGTDRVIVLHGNGGVTLIDGVSGKILWRLRPTSERERLGHIVVSGDTVFGTSAVGGVSAFRLVQK